MFAGLHGRWQCVTRALTRGLLRCGSVRLLPCDSCAWQERDKASPGDVIWART
ncbi:MAG: hypothetical protein RLZZ436_2103 [Planctomycetota bacterium]|jgi:hypothetical protein